MNRALDPTLLVLIIVTALLVTILILQDSEMLAVALHKSAHFH
jgi:hypothetical protein